MKIGIDLTAVPRNKSGVGRYLVNLVKHLQELDYENDYFIFVQDDDLDGFPVFNTGFKFVPVNSKHMRRTFFRMAWEQLVLPVIPEYSR